MRARGPLAAFAVFGVFWGAWGVLLPAVKEQVGASVTELGIALLFVSAAGLPAMVLTGRAVDRFGSRAVAPALLLFAVAAVLPGFTDSVVELALTLVLVGAASGALDVSINVAASTAELSGGRIMQLAHAFFSAGFLVAAVAVGLAREAGSEPLPVLIGVAVAVVLVAAMNRRLPAAPPRPDGRQRVVSRRLLLLGALCAVAFIVESAIEQWSALFLERELDARPAVSGLGPGFFGAAMVGGRLIGQALDVRVGDRTLLVGGAVTAAVGLAIAATAPVVPVALLGFTLGGSGIAVAAPALLGAAGRSAEEADRGSAVASVTTVAYLGFLIGPPLIGTVSGALDLRFGLGLVAAIAAALAVSAASLRDALPVRRLQPAERGRLSEPC